MPFKSAFRQSFRYALFAIAIALIAAGFMNYPASAGAEEKGTLTIPLNDGYGFDDCLKPGSECGLVVADAWCKAHGFAGAEGFGAAEDPRTAAKPGSGSVSVICGGRVN
ncbi:MAG TPA: hypothetical protein VFG05_02000 [Methylocella sp.]|nr:hypothetical protein [Methylocella sp.]